MTPLESLLEAFPLWDVLSAAFLLTAESTVLFVWFYVLVGVETVSLCVLCRCSCLVRTMYEARATSRVLLHLPLNLEATASAQLVGQTGP